FGAKNISDLPEAKLNTEHSRLQAPKNLSTLLHCVPHGLSLQGFGFTATLILSFSPDIFI
ncbi:MAG: hypothetical protein ACOC0T_06500, partial [Desulfovermiculus sp.]